jgi:hypothetical protein
VARFLVLTLRSCGAALPFLLLGCGSGLPLLHGAHALSPGSTLTGVGFSSTFTGGAAREAVEAARRGDASSSERTELLTKHAAVMAALAPSVAPFVGMRLGIAGDNEVGLSYTGRFLRLDARHAFENGPWAFSVGAGGHGTLNSANPGTESASTPSPVSARSYGVDVPLLVGWRSDAGIVSLWGGARGGLARVEAPGSTGAGSSDLALTHWRAGAVAGLTMGFRYLHVALELETAYHGLKGTSGDAKVEVNGFTLTPAGGLLVTF